VRLDQSSVVNNLKRGKNESAIQTGGSTWILKEVEGGRPWLLGYFGDLVYRNYFSTRLGLYSYDSWWGISLSGGFRSAMDVLAPV